MRIIIRRIGNSNALIIPAAMLQKIGIESEAEASIEDGALVVRVPVKPVRDGWAQASDEIAKRGDDALLLPNFSNADDEELWW
jgi:antitoxin MazE